MDLLYSPLGVLLLLAFIAIVAYKFEPSSYVGNWQTLHDWFGQQKKPLDISHPNETIEVSGYAHCDATTAAEGLWIQYNGPVPPKVPPCLFIPWLHFRLRHESEKTFTYLIKRDAATKKVVRMTVGRELGEAMQRRIPKRDGDPA